MCLGKYLIRYHGARRAWDASRRPKRAAPPSPTLPHPKNETSFAGALAARLPNLVDLLQPDFDDATALQLRHAYAECLTAAVREAQEEAEEAAAGARAGGPGVGGWTVAGRASSVAHAEPAGARSGW
jgi:hypothetical protein